MYPGAANGIVDPVVKGIEQNVKDPERRADIYRRASTEAASLAAKTPGFDGAKLPSLASEGVNPRIARSVERVRPSAEPGIAALDVKDAPIKMLRPGEGVHSKNDEAAVPDRPSAESRLDQLQTRDARPAATTSPRGRLRNGDRR